jgi:predicted nucleic acid-binding protein
MIVADTDVLTDYLTGKGRAGDVEVLIRRGAIQTTVISRFELTSGAKNTDQLTRVTALLDAVPSLPLNDAGADLASEIRRLLERSGKSIGMADSLIAGIVIHHSGALLTRNRKHFERVPGLHLA